ncbi:MAG TPA: hypothetical protein VK487_00175 [Candidatus Bathyarchaeia archaeon]|nr:hypothetical protein [Candidatus Bathyarchaeia archaeon]
MTEKKEISQRSVLVLNIVGMMIALVNAACVWLITTHFEILSTVSLFSNVRTLLLISFLLVALPIAALGEYWLSKTNKRKFLWKSVVLIVGIFGLFILVTTVLITVFDELLSGLFWIWQMPLVVASGLIGLFTVIVAIRNEHIKKWEKDFGW